MTELRKLSSESLLIKAGDYILVLVVHLCCQETLRNISLNDEKHVVYFIVTFCDHHVPRSDCCEQLSMWIVQPASL